ncbi:MAG: NADPH-dependent FMN reductase [Candidatus Dormibacteria bacterium]
MNVLAISGSLREGSHHTALLRALSRLSAGGVTVQLLLLHDIPHFNEDLESPGPPRSVARLRGLVADADAVVIATPEYNGGITGALKDSVDWLSRPRDAVALRGKPVATLSASPGGHGAIWAQEALRSSLQLLGAQLVGPPLSISQVHLRVAGSGPDGELKAEVGLVLDRLAAAVASSSRAAAS